MKAAHIIYAACSLVLISFGARAQHTPDGREMVMYDPLFWKDELSLRTTQARQIEQINTEFYENLRSTAESSQPENNRRQLEEGLQQRSQRIWNTLAPKQRRKLEKIIDKTAPTVAP